MRRTGRARRALATALGGVTLVAAGLVATADASPAPTAGFDAGPAAVPTARVDNPYVGAQTYVNPEWSARAAAEPGGAAVADQPTFVWLDSVAALHGADGAMGLRDHLDAALDQGVDLVQLVLHNLPGRDCDWLWSEGELSLDDLPRYREEFVDPIAAVLADPAYAGLRIVTVVEPDAVPNLVTYAALDEPQSTEGCRQALGRGTHLQAVGYALSRLGPLPNVYPYLDVGNRGRFGFEEEARVLVDLLHLAASTAGAEPGYVHGFATNVADHAPTREPHYSADDLIDGVPVREGSSWLSGNRFADELPYAQAVRRALVAEGFDPGIGMLVDTSRNGWGGPDRPTGPGPRTTAEEYVEASRTDRRLHPVNWCNQAGAGLGERPVAVPAPGVDAYAWVKPPGESDGASIPLPQEGTGYSPLCDPTYSGNTANGNNPSGSLPDAPPVGDWHSAHFRGLLAHAWPPLP
ncbi:glycoside hydrolase family 6 protein [Streptomyces sp. 4N509B]|uniref:glycoside hydrolase family 6 protein n=1 Tax=Streptomyces sp. 4N509B TaxID=3457413 RepID=UPI003FD3780E